MFSQVIAKVRQVLQSSLQCIQQKVRACEQSQGSDVVLAPQGLRVEGAQRLNRADAQFTEDSGGVQSCGGSLMPHALSRPCAS